MRREDIFWERSCSPSLAPHSSVQTLTVPVADGIAERRVTDGVLDRDAIVAQTRAAVSMLRAGDPDRIVTFGGDCSVSAAPFAFWPGSTGMTRP